jgi:hypothetical protein
MNGSHVGAGLASRGSESNALTVPTSFRSSMIERRCNTRSTSTVEDHANDPAVIEDGCAADAPIEKDSIEFEHAHLRGADHLVAHHIRDAGLHRGRVARQPPVVVPTRSRAR